MLRLLADGPPAGKHTHLGGDTSATSGVACSLGGGGGSPPALREGNAKRKPRQLAPRPRRLRRAAGQRQVERGRACEPLVACHALERKPCNVHQHACHRILRDSGDGGTPISGVRGVAQDTRRRLVRSLVPLPVPFLVSMVPATKTRIRVWPHAGFRHGRREWDAARSCRPEVARSASWSCVPRTGIVQVVGMVTQALIPGQPRTQRQPRSSRRKRPRIRRRARRGSARAGSPRKRLMTAARSPAETWISWQRPRRRRQRATPGKAAPLKAAPKSHSKATMGALAMGRGSATEGSASKGERVNRARHLEARA